MTFVRPDRVVVVSDFASVRGGASKLAMTQAELLATQGIPVTVFAGDESSSAPAGIDVVLCGGQRLLEQGKVSAVIQGLWNRTVQVRLRDWIERFDTNGTIYHVHGLQQTLSPSVLAPLAAVKHRVVMHAHDYFLACPNGAFFDFNRTETCNRRGLSLSCIARNCDKRNYGNKLWRVARQATQNYVRSSLLPNAMTILIHSAMENRLFPEGTSGRVTTVPNPADAIVSPPVSAERNSDFLYVGDMHRYKGIFVLAESARRSGIALCFVGDGQDLPTLREQYPEHRYLGWQSGSELSTALSKARVLVAPTLGPEPYGLAPIEALLSGVPVVLSDEMLLSRDVEALGIGRSFKSGDSDALARVLSKMAQDDAQIAQMSRDAPIKSRNLSLTPQDWRDKLCETYAVLLDQNTLCV